MKYLFMTAALLIACVYTTIAQFSDPALHQMRVDVVYLASDYLEGREAGTKGEMLAAEYIARRFEEIGLSPKGDNQGWMQVFDFKYNPNPHAAGGESRQGRNVVGYIDNRAKTTVVIGAHFDHLGKGEFGSRHTGEAAIHNGADDNASGVAALIYLATRLKNSKVKKNNYLFIAFSAEELGLLGSKAYVNSANFDATTVNYMLNMDMVGRLNEDNVLVINGVGTSPVWKETLPKITAGNLKIKTTDSGVGPSDHTSFYLKDIPAMHFFSGQHTDYHKPGDDAGLINFDGIKRIGDFMFALIESLDKSGKLAFSKTKDEEEGRQAARYKVSLGVMPDYAYDGEGMRVDDVLSGRAAEKGGLKKGDVIIEIGEMKVKDIYGYMEGLGKFNAGDKTMVKVRRGEEVLTLEVTF
ncbi:MAG: M20/M25/M40 family metallo-hydrolase [Saprospiraceae bacterium]|nr:M20/M25/M40 family metallo-hydrolase [Saprospiraceae bacterium]